MAASNPDLVRKLNALYNDYMSIDDDRALRRSGMTHAEWNALPDVFTKLQKAGSTKTFMSGLANYFRKFGFNVSDDGYGQFVITASRRIRKRPINASSSSIRTDFQKFVGELEADLQDNERALRDCARLQGSFMSDSDGAIFDITPTCYGMMADDIDTLRIEYDANTGEYTAYCAGNDDLVAEGYSFNDISFNCYNWLKETLIQMYENYDDEFYH